MGFALHTVAFGPVGFCPWLFVSCGILSRILVVHVVAETRCKERGGDNNDPGAIFMP